MLRDFLFVVLLSAFISGCVSGYQQFYSSYVDPQSLSEVELLKEDEDPKIFLSDDLERDIRVARSRRYIPIGYSSFNGELEGDEGIKKQARQVRATLVLVKSEYTNTQTVTTPLFIPNQSTTYHQGIVNAYGSGGHGYGSYSGTSTTYSSAVVPVTTQRHRYNQTAVFFVRSNQPFRIGVSVRDLTPQERLQLERNTGAVVDVVVEDSPAFFANLLPGDVLVRIDRTDVRNMDHAHELMKAVPHDQGAVRFDMLRNGEPRSVDVQLSKK